MEIAEYEGEVVNGQNHGKGSCLYADGSSYKVEWHNDMRYGKGTFQSGRTKYEGLWKDDKRDGYGVYEDLTVRFEGLWKDDEMWKGEHTSSYQRYKGEFKNGKYDGQGTMYIRVIASGIQNSWVPLYEGEWKHAKPHGFGKKYFTVHVSNTEQYYVGLEGNWVEGKLHGYVREYTQNHKLCFEGEYESDARNGFGKEYVGDRIVYEGMWANGLKHGKGTSSTNTRRFVGTYQNGVPTQGKVYNGQNELEYEGAVCDDFSPCGYGISYSNGRTLYEGYWKKHHSMHGEGILHLNGIWEGKFSHNQLELGTYRASNGDVFKKTSSWWIGRIREDNTTVIGQFHVSQPGTKPRKHGLVMVTKSGSSKRTMERWDEGHCVSSQMYLGDWTAQELITWLKAEVK